MQGLRERIMDKGLSGRFIAMNLVVFTYCLTIGLTLFLVAEEVVQWEMFIAVFTPFAMLAKDTVQNYFQRDDRTKPDSSKLTIETTEQPKKEPDK